MECKHDPQADVEVKSISAKAPTDTLQTNLVTPPLPTTIDVNKHKQKLVKTIAEFEIELWYSSIITLHMHGIPRTVPCSFSRVKCQNFSYKSLFT